MKNIKITKHVGVNIRILRKSHGMHTRTLAKELNISQQQLSRYERGVNKIDISLIYRLHVFFNISIDTFLKILMMKLNIILNMSVYLIKVHYRVAVTNDAKLLHLNG